MSHVYKLIILKAGPDRYYPLIQTWFKAKEDKGCARDILRVMPELIEIIQEENKIESLNILDESKKHPKRAGYCDDCGEWSDTLEEVNGEYLCEECRDSCSSYLNNKFTSSG